MMTESPENSPPPSPSLPSRSPSPPDGGWLAQAHLAASFLTRFPLPDPGYVPGGLAPAMRAFPLVGAGLGALAGGLGALALGWLPALPAALLVVLALTLATGALHEDGLADLADGLGARGERERRLEVMRDSRIGAYGVLALVFSIGLRVSAVAALPGGWDLVGAVAAASALSRAMIPVVMQILPPARPDGLGAGAGTPDASVAATAALLGLLAAVLALGPGGALAAAVLAAGFSLAVAMLARRAIGGHTGDVLGAVQQAAEIGVLLAAAMVWA